MIFIIAVGRLELDHSTRMPLHRKAWEQKQLNGLRVLRANLQTPVSEYRRPVQGEVVPVLNLSHYEDVGKWMYSSTYS
jgi:hypothetical protein